MHFESINSSSGINKSYMFKTAKKTIQFLTATVVIRNRSSAERSLELKPSRNDKRRNQGTMRKTRPVKPTSFFSQQGMFSLIYYR